MYTVHTIAEAQPTRSLEDRYAAIADAHNAEREKAWDEGYRQGLVYNSPSASMMRENKQLRSQLAAQLDALKEAREIHKAMRPDLPIETLLRLSLQFNQVIDAALAAVKEGK